MAKKFFVLVVAWALVGSACTAPVDDLVTGDPQPTPVATSPEPTSTGDVPTPAPAAEQAAEEEASTATSEPARDFSVLSALALIPASATVEASGALQVSVGDIDAAADQARLRPPLDPSDPDDLVEFFSPLTGYSRDGRPLRIFVPVPQLVRDGAPRAEEFIDELGFPLGEISSFATVESLPASFSVFEGVTARDDVPEVAPGVRTFGEGDDLAISLEGRTAVRPLGRPLRVAHQGDYLGLSLTTPPLVDWLDGSYVSLADDPILEAMAERLDEEQVVSAFLLAEQEAGPSGTAIGWRADDRGPQGVIVLAYDREATAAAALDAVIASFEGSAGVDGPPLAEAIVLESVELLGADIVAVVSFANDRPPSVLFQLLISQDGPFSPT